MSTMECKYPGCIACESCWSKSPPPISAFATTYGELDVPGPLELKRSCATSQWKVWLRALEKEAEVNEKHGYMTEIAK